MLFSVDNWPLDREFIDLTKITIFTSSPTVESQPSDQERLGDMV